MVYVERKNILNHYNCSMFEKGCPDNWYYSNEIYKCTYLLKTSIIKVSGTTIKVKACYYTKCMLNEVHPYIHRDGVVGTERSLSIQLVRCSNP